MSHIFIILIDISSCPWALCTFKDLINLRILSLLKSSEHNLSWVKNFWLNGSTQPFFKGVYRSAKNVLKTFAFVLISVTIFLSIKGVGISRIFFHYKKFWEWTNMSLLGAMDYSAFSQGSYGTMSWWIYVLHNSQGQFSGT